MSAVLLIQLFILVLGLAIIAIVDFRTRTIPDWVLVLLTAVGLGFQALAISPLAALASVVFYFLCFWLIRKAHHLATGRIGLGFGDVKMAGAAGAWITIGAAPLFIGLASLTALVSVACAAAFGGSAALKQRIPFGPFLGLSLLVCWILRVSDIGLDGFYDAFSIG